MRWSAVVLLGLLLLVGGYSFDAEQAFAYYGSKISPNHPEVGVFIFLMIMALIIFSDEILAFFKVGKGKIKLKKKF